MINLKVDGETIQYKSWLQVHDDFVKKYDCSCCCRDCCEAEPKECAVSTLDQCHEWEEIK